MYYLCLFIAGILSVCSPSIRGSGRGPGRVGPLPSSLRPLPALGVAPLGSPADATRAAASQHGVRPSARRVRGAHRPVRSPVHRGRH